MYHGGKKKGSKKKGTKNKQKPLTDDVSSIWLVKTNHIKGSNIFTNAETANVRRLQSV